MIALFLSGFIYASIPNIDLQLELDINGNKTPKVQFLTEAGQETILNQKLNGEDISINVVSQVVEDETISIKFTVKKANKIISEAEILTFDQLEAEILVGSEKEKLGLKVTPTIL